MRPRQYKQTTDFNQLMWCLDWEVSVAFGDLGDKEMESPQMGSFSLHPAELSQSRAIAPDGVARAQQRGTAGPGPWMEGPRARPFWNP